MPIINLNGPKLSTAKKKELVKRFTEVASEVIELPEEAIIVEINEMPPENVGVGGELLSEKEDK
ncbi:4-oxalocrotonate tautomerase family enzyme [Halobacteroides halobius DSM 5150]|uniref:Tautomerase n=1 Tax=Halobacteroides halobius (strain ATCC 35273 / DSM 5150 / MD-1) TaxID=748449 RepID=L0K7M3_HALHC|nr:4-oxalocrotonate tautomerase DmpI [Halobacteroides halobius]AGB40339.1 4-oxalocrotonate tautomerase family enzyme [Halobacteroides halobius DSM 5150]